MNLCVPGPTRCPPEVLEACSKAMINHRGPEFKRLLNHVTEKFKEVCHTQNDVLFLTSSGTGALEAAIVNFFTPGDTVLIASNGHFADRLVDMAKRHRLSVSVMHGRWDSAVDPEELKFCLDNIPNIKAVFLVHNETSTGITNDLETLAEIIKSRQKLLIVDAMSSLGAIPVKIDEWGLDVVTSASQKAFMCPPGVSMITVSREAWQAHREARMPRYYFDLTKARNSLTQGLTSWTPAISIFYGLNVALNLMLAEGMENIFARHRRLAQKMRRNLKIAGFKLFAKNESTASDTVTVFKIPPEIEENKLVERLAEHDTVVGRGAGEMLGHVLRIGHMGWVDDNYIDDLSVSLTVSYRELGWQTSRCIP